MSEIRIISTAGDGKEHPAKVGSGYTKVTLDGEPIPYLEHVTIQIGVGIPNSVIFHIRDTYIDSLGKHQVKIHEDGKTRVVSRTFIISSESEMNLNVEEVIYVAK